MAYTTESGLMDDIYDYLFENEANIGTNFLRAFPDSYVDTENAKIHLIGEGFKEYIIKIERVS